MLILTIILRKTLLESIYLFLAHFYFSTDPRTLWVRQNKYLTSFLSQKTATCHIDKIERYKIIY